jgi:hypothetical protein
MNYYPPELTDWWLDDWISLVYGRNKTFMASKVTVLHHTGGIQGIMIFDGSLYLMFKPISHSSSLSFSLSLSLSLS